MTQTPPICNYEGSDYQSTFWDQGGRSYEDQAEAVALRRLLPSGGKLMLEIGAGAGRNTPRYAGFERVVLVDYSLTQLQQAQERLGRSARYVYVAADVYHLPFMPGIFDAATMIRVLHHMADAPLALRQVRAALAPGGTFILEFANKQNLKAILRFWLGRQSWSPFSKEPVEFAALNFDFHPQAVKAYLKQTGFILRRQLTVSHFRIGLFKRLAPTSLLVWLDSLAQLTGDWWQVSPSVFTCSQADALGSRHEAANMFRCLVCGNTTLQVTALAVACPGCGQAWPVVDGIYDFRLRESVPG